jgi:uncharacterized membrane protein YfcA
MGLETLLVVELALLGIATGFLAGLLGIGGGMLMVPFVTFVLAGKGIPPEYTVKMAVATSLATIAFTSLSSVRAHHQRGGVLWPVVRVLAPGILVGSLVGAQIAVALPGKALGILFAIFVAFSATQMLLERKPKATRTLPGPLGTFLAGNVIGLLSSLVGAGGAFVSVPFMTWCNVPIHNAVATSAALGFPIAVANVLGYVVSGQSVQGLPDGAFGYIWLPALAVIAVCSVLTAPLGAKAAHNLPVKKLKRVFASILYLLAAYMLWKGLQG